MRPLPHPGPAGRLARSVWYRYFFCGWLFRDVSVGTLLERAAAWRHNREQAHWLATYMRRWFALATLFYLLGALVELAAATPAASVVFFVPSALSVSVNAVLAAAWLGFKTLPPPL